MLLNLIYVLRRKVKCIYLDKLGEVDVLFLNTSYHLFVSDTN